MENLSTTWWELELPPPLKSAQTKYKKSLAKSRPVYDRSLAIKTASFITNRIHGKLDRILRYKHLGLLCHLINGCGNAIWQKKPLLAHLPRYIIGTNPHNYRIRQNAKADGDYHPWQIFAYAIMAGIPLTEKVPGLNIDLKTLAKNSNMISHIEGGELGHLLFALAHMPEVKELYLKKRLFSVEEIMQSALKEHHYEFYAVCRMIHLTEGTCAAAAKLPQLQKYKKQAQANLTAQLDKLFAIGLLLEKVESALSAGKIRIPRKDDFLKELGKLLVIKNLPKDLYHFVGHLTELAIFASSFNYKVSDAHWQAIFAIINKLNFHLSAGHIRARQAFDVALLAHYRRAITLLFEVDKCRRNKKPLSFLSARNLRRYTVNFDQLPLMKR